jgi:acyl-CoA synthetase (AMP-forming)/AMP-acid ligase II
MDSTVPAAFAAAVARFGERCAVIGEDGASLSYAELDKQRKRAARALIWSGIQPGDRVAIWAQNRVEWIIAGLAIHSVGAVLVPLNTRMKGPEAAYVLEKSGARLLFCAGRWIGQDYPALIAPCRPASLEFIVVLDDCDGASLREGDERWLQFLSGADRVCPLDVDDRSGALTADSRLDILFTSGTTGLPKGVVTSHGQNLRVIADWSRAMGLVPEDRYLIVNPFFHSFGYKVGWLGGLLAGCTILPQAMFDAAAILRRIAVERISVLPGPPTLFISLLDDPARATADLSSLRATITGAAAIAPSLIERIRSELGFRTVLTGYGLTETCGVVALCDAGDDAETIALSSGKAIPDIELRCVDADGRALPPGESGEIVVRGYNVMQGYLDDEAATREAVDAEGWLHTGDVGSLDARGYLRITDRLKDMYITGGFNCYPAEIERTLAAHPAIAQAAVIGVDDARMGEVGKAFLILRPGMQIDAAELIAWCRERMANYKVPRHIEVRTALPVNPGGKVMKFQLRREARQREPENA